jgi:hypothetical protein
MALRLTPQNALATARQLSQDLARWLEDAGTIGPAPRLCGTLTLLQETLAANSLGVDVGGPSELLNELLAGSRVIVTQSGENSRRISLGRRDGGLILRNIDLAESPADRAGSLFHPFLLFSTAVGVPNPNAIDSHLVDRPIAICLGSSSGSAEWQGEPWTMECACSVAELSNTSFGRLFTPAGDALFDSILAYSVVASLDSLSRALDLAVDAELRGLQAKKAVTQQRVVRSQQRTGSVTSSVELVGELRGRIQRQFAEFERGLNDRLQELFLPQIGNLSKMVDKRLEAIQTLDDKQQSGKTSLAVSAGVEAELMNDVRSDIEGELCGDLVAMRDMFRLVQTDMEGFLESRGAPPIVPQFQYLTEDRLYRLLDNNLILQRRYSGEMKHGGLFEYAMASRRYLSLMFMALSSFGLLSYFRRSPVIMLPVTFFVLIIGGLVTVNSARRERIETSQREIEKARELLRSEFKRAFAEVQRGWSGILCQHLAEQLQNTLSRAEAAIRDFQSRQSTDASDEKQRIQRQLQNLETTEKRLQMSARGRDTVGKAISQTRGELKQLILSLVKTQPVKAAL